jgi:hypothetical protein
VRSVLGLGKAEHMNGQRLGNDFGDAHARIERSEGVLNNHLHLAALRAQLFSAQREKISRVKTEFTAVRFDQSQEHTCQGGLAAAAFADDGKVSPHLTETYIIDGGEAGALGFPRKNGAASPVRFPEVWRFQQDFRAVRNSVRRRRYGGDMLLIFARKTAAKLAGNEHVCVRESDSALETHI